MQSLAERLNVSFRDFVRTYTRRVNGEFSLVEKPKPGHQWACVFYEDGCTVYEQRPEQCRTFPFWSRYQHGRNEAEIDDECPGVRLLSDS